jgi:SpoVK/Ycf46/Vps4 family AAA+-type ATPase
VRDLFEQARAKAPAIIFIDELDALGRARGAFGLGGHDEKEQTLNQLLSEMDGFDASVGLIILAATNRPEILDAALLRAGRFDRQVLVDRPDRQGRAEILKVHVRKVALDPAVALDAVAALTPGFTGADLANLVNEAALLAARHGKKLIGMTELEEGIMRVLAGPEKKTRIISEKEKALAALWSDVPIQRCTVHKHRNLLAHAPERLHEEISNDYKDMIYAASKQEVEAKRKAFVRKWRLKCRAVADSLEEAGDKLFTFTRFPPSQWKSIRTSNAIERLHEEFKRRIKTQTVLPCAETAAMLFWALMASGQIIMRKVAGWQSLAEKPANQIIDLAA